MSAQIAKEEIALLMPERLGHYFKDDPEYMVVPEATGSSIFSKIAGAFRWLAEMPKRRAVIDELAGLSDHELSDIGLSRSELGRVFEPGFAAERNAGKGRAALARPAVI